MLNQKRSESSAADIPLLRSSARAFCVIISTSAKALAPNSKTVAARQHLELAKIAAGEPNTRGVE